MGRGVLDYVGTFALRFLSAIRPHANPATREATEGDRTAGRPQPPHGTAGPPPPRAAFAAVALLPRGRGPRGIGSAYLSPIRGRGLGAILGLYALAN